MIKNDSGVKPIWKNDVLICIGDTEFFRKKVAGSLYAPIEMINQAISNSVDGIVLEMGKDCFKTAGIDVKLGDKIMFQGFHGSIFSRKKPTEKDANNKIYYRIIKDTDFKGFCTEKQEFELFF